MVELDAAFDLPYAIAGSLIGSQIGLLGYGMEKLGYDPMDVEGLGVSGPAAAITLLTDYKLGENIHPELEVSAAGSAALTYKTLNNLEEGYRSWERSSFEELRQELDNQTVEELPEFEE